MLRKGEDVTALLIPEIEYVEKRDESIFGNTVA
jgi:hypothetical protein